MKLFSLLAASDKLLEGLIVAVIVLAAIGVIALAVVLIVGNRAAKNRKTNAKTPVQQTPSQPKPKAEPFKPEIIQKPTNKCWRRMEKRKLSYTIGRNRAFELWCWRTLLRVPWTVRRSNQSILKEINPEYSLEELMLKLQYLRPSDVKN